MSTLTLYPSGPPSGVDLGASGAVVTNYGTGTVSYSDTADPFVAKGTIAPSASATLTGTQFFRAAAGAVLNIAEADASLGSLEEIRAQLLAVESSNATKISGTLVDGKGDLLVATAADTVARLAVGTNGQVLMADSTAGAGVKWGDSPTLGAANVWTGQNTSKANAYYQDSGARPLVTISPTGTGAGTFAGQVLLHGAGGGDSSNRLWYWAVDVVAAVPYRDSVWGKILSNGTASDADGIYISHGGTGPSTIGVGMAQPGDSGASFRLKVRAPGTATPGMGSLLIPFAAGQTGDLLYVEKNNGLAAQIKADGTATFQGSSATQFVVQSNAPSPLFTIDTTGAGRITAPVQNMSVGLGATTSQSDTFTVAASSTSGASLTVTTASWGQLNLIASGVSPGDVQVRTGRAVALTFGTNGVMWARITPTGDFIIGKSALATPVEMATTDTAGFAFMPCGNGPPTGVPSSRTGSVPWYFDRANSKIYIYNGGWKATAALT